MTVKLIEKCQLYDNLGPHDIDSAYALKGVTEGWLSYQGYFRDSRNVIWHQFALKK